MGEKTNEKLFVFCASLINKNNGIESHTENVGREIPHLTHQERK